MATPHPKGGGGDGNGNAERKVSFAQGHKVCGKFPTNFLLKSTVAASIHAKLGNKPCLFIFNTSVDYKLQMRKQFWP